MRCLKDSQYEERVQLLKLDSLFCRMNKGDMIQAYKILHGSHLGVDKMKSLASQTVWWPDLNVDISSFVSKCARCLFKKPSVKPSSWTPLPLTYMSWQRINVGCCGSFLNKYYALILINSEVFLTTNADGAFTKLAMRRTFSHEVVPLTLVTDNETHFTSSEVQDWLELVGCR